MGPARYWLLPSVSCILMPHLGRVLLSFKYLPYDKLSCTVAVSVYPVFINNKLVQGWSMP
jgi:hypothetical protein